MRLAGPRFYAQRLRGEFGGDCYVVRDAHGVEPDVLPPARGWLRDASGGQLVGAGVDQRQERTEHDWCRARAREMCLGMLPPLAEVERAQVRLVGLPDRNEAP